jgi:predicted nucleotidyltransferase
VTARPPAVDLAREVATRVGALDGVVAVALGGSAGRGLADDRSHLDLAVYYDPARPFSVAELAALVTAGAAARGDLSTSAAVPSGRWPAWSRCCSPSTGGGS